MKTLALINARGNSKGVPRKNVRPLDGIPLIAWTIHTAKSTPVFSSVVVSSVSLTLTADVSSVAEGSSVFSFFCASSFFL